MSHSPFATALSAQLCSLLPIVDEKELASAIDFNIKYIDKHRDDFASLLFLEFANPPQDTIDSKLARKVVARVSKRIYRSTRQFKQPLPIDVEAKSENSSMQIKLDIDEFLKTLSASDSILFSLRYLDDEPVSSICQKIGMEKSVIYERLDKLRNRFKNFYP